MKIWNYISEFILFRWLFGKLFGSRKAPADHSKVTIIDTVDIDDGHADAVTTETLSISDELTQPEETEELDDLDIYMRDYELRKSGIYGHDYGDSMFHDEIADDYDPSLDDFYDEQDDYDLMDDF